jgi:hypothetical protein
MILLAVEATGILVEIMAFTMMGIIVNAGSTLRYVSMALLFGGRFRTPLLLS